MAFVNQLGRELTLKIAYHGPGLGGKTTNLRWLHQTLPSDQRGELLTLDTATERTLFFDFLLVRLGEVAGYRVNLQLFTVPGQLYYDASRKLILKGVDAIVLVADSQTSRMSENEESRKLLMGDLIAIGIRPEEVPLVVQYNKRDLPDAATIEDLQARLNPTGQPYFQAVARHGVGVMPTLRLVTALAMRGLFEQGGAPAAGPGTAAR